MDPVGRPVGAAVPECGRDEPGSALGAVRGEINILPREDEPGCNAAAEELICMCTHLAFKK